MGVRGGGMLCRNMRTDSSQHVNVAFLCRGLEALPENAEGFESRSIYQILECLRESVQQNLEKRK